MSRRKEIFQHASRYTASSQLTQIITLVAAILSRRFLGPLEMGIWATLQVVIEYAKYASLGTFYSVIKEIPYQIGRNKKKTAGTIKDIVFTTTLATTLILGTGIFIYAWLTKGQYPKEITFGLFFVAAIVVLQRLNDFFINLLRAYKKFTIASKQMIFSAVVNAALIGVLAFHYKIYGFMVAMGLSFVFNLIYIQSQAHFHFRVKFNWPRFRALVGFGSPLMLVGILWTVLRTIDKIVIAKFISFEALGFYSIAILAATYVRTFFNSFAIVLFPHFQEKYSAKDDPNDLKEFLGKATLGYALTTPFLIGLVWIIAPPCIYLLLPKYLPGIAAMKFLVCGMFFYSLAQPYSDFLITIKKHLILLPLLAITSGLAFAGNMWAVASGTGIVGVAGAMVVSAFFYFTAIYFWVLRSLSGERKAFVKYLGFLVCGAYPFLVLVVLGMIFPSGSSSILQSLVQLILFVISYIPLFVKLEKQFSILEYLRERKHSKKAKEGSEDVSTGSGTLMP